MQLLRQNWCLAICKIISSNFKLCDKSPIWNIRDTLTQTLFNILTFYIKLYLISAHIYTEYGHSQGMSLIYRCCPFSKYQHSPLAGIPLDLLCSSRKSSPEHKMMFLSTDCITCEIDFSSGIAVTYRLWRECLTLLLKAII